MKKIIIALILVILVSLILGIYVIKNCYIKATDFDTSGLTTLNYVEPMKPLDVPYTEDILQDIIKNNPYYKVTEEEREILAKLVYLESSICSLECQKMVVSVVFNRLYSGIWTQDMNNDGYLTLYDIIYYPYAFSPAYLISTTTPDENAYTAVDYVIDNGPNIPEYVMFFRSSYGFNWKNYRNYKIIDNMYFGYFYR